jgi:sulfite exporter TauE/SafE
MVAFLTGLITGGLNCLAVQGGLLASTLAHQYEQDLQNNHTNQKLRPHLAQPISLFLLAKLIAYTLLGLLVGALGSFFMLTPMMRTVLMIAIGIFMLGNGLRMLKIHPIFRYFVFEPPSALTRYFRRVAKKDTTVLTPLFMGAMTVLLPCGVAQSMIALALGTGSPTQGAALLFAFTLGTTPVFFAVSYFATRFGAALEKYFTRIAAVTIILLALVSINSGLNLAWSPFSINNLLTSLNAPASAEALAQNASLTPGNYVVTAKDDGYYPAVLHLAAGKPVVLTWVSKNLYSCARSIVVPALNYEKILPNTGEVPLAIPAQDKGTIIRYSCSMGMYTGQLVFDQE